VGICGVLAMGTLTTVLGGSHAQAAGPVLTDKPSQTGAGDTVTMQTAPPPAPAVPNAAPGVQAQPWQGKGWPANGWFGIGGNGHTH
jgi:hypothetical protein